MIIYSQLLINKLTWMKKKKRVLNKKAQNGNHVVAQKQIV